jgi:hypothetical protein
VKVGLGVLVGVGVAVGDATNEVNEQPRTLAMTSTATNAAEVVLASFLPVIVKWSDPPSQERLAVGDITSQSGSWKTSRLGIGSAPQAPRCPLLWAGQDEPKADHL